MIRTTSIIGALLAISVAAQSQAACTRAELKSTIDSYFTALAAHDTKASALAKNVRFTENGAEIKAGEGFWKSAGKLVFSRSALDTETCGTVTQAVIEENGRNILFGVRLKLDDKKQISEIEHIIAREKEFAFKPQGVLETRDHDWEGILQPDQRTSRAAMVAAVNDYYDMFTKTPEVSVPFANPCHRWENGTKTTPRADCSPKGLVLVHPERRVPVVDREAGIAVAFVFFNGALPDFHMFKFRSGHVELIQSVIGPRAAATGWPDDKSLSRRVPPADEVRAPPVSAPPSATPAPPAT
jgi:hypothetical protein